MTEITTTGELLRKAWEFEWSINVGCAVVTAVYFWKVKAAAWRRVLFVLGILVMMFALQSPTDVLGDDYLFSAHMAEHLLLILMTAPFFVLGISERSARGWLRVGWVRKTEAVLGRPLVAWLLGTGTMTIWHVPLFYNLALAHQTVHIFQHLSFLVTAVIFWWPVLNPLPERRMQTGLAIFYLFMAVAENSVLGITLTFMAVGHYPQYVHPEDELGALNLIRNGWGLTPEVDQRLGGLMMWIPGCSVYFIAILGLFAHWYAQPEPDEPGAGELGARTYARHAAMQNGGAR